MHGDRLWLAEQAGREPCGIRRHHPRRCYLCSAPPEKSMQLQGCGHGEISVGFNQSVSACAPPSVFPHQRVCRSSPEIAQTLLSNRRRRRLLVLFWSFSCAARLELQLTLVLSDLMLIYFCWLNPPGTSAPPKTEAWSFIPVHSAHFQRTFKQSGRVFTPLLIWRLVLQNLTTLIIQKQGNCHVWAENQRAQKK